MVGKAGRRKGRKRYSLYRKLEKAGYSRDFRRLVNRKGTRRLQLEHVFRDRTYALKFLFMRQLRWIL